MKEKKRIIFMGTPDIAAEYLNSLLINNYNVIGVYCQPPRPKDRGMLVKPSPVENLSKKNNIPCFSPVSLNNEKEVKRFKVLKSDIAIVMGYGILIPKSFLNLPLLGCINIHFSLLPKWRGAAPVEYALMKGEKETGITIFKLNEKFDQGPILNSSRCKITDTMTKNQLQENLNKIGINLLLTTLPKYFSNELNLKKQDEDKATYAPKIFTKDRKIDFSKNANEIYNTIRSVAPKPGAWFKFNKERIKILSCVIKSLKGKPSTILSNDLIIGCYDRSIQPKIIQREGRKSMNIKEFLRGFVFKIGDEINTDE